jgi:Restriction endonuclease
MPFSLPADPDIKRQLKARLLELTPRAFEFFAGDLLTYIGLQNVAVTRHTGDGGIDAHGDLMANSGLVRVPTGVQVKRHRNNVRRPDIDRFIGALGGRFHHGIFITTASYAVQARDKAASSPLLRVDTVDGAQLTSLMVMHDLGIQVSSVSIPQLDEDYFLAFEAQADLETRRIRETPEVYQAGASTTLAVEVRPEDDLISLKALSYALRVDMQRLRRGWIETGKLHPDATRPIGAREAYFFRRDRVEDIRRRFTRDRPPASSAEWRQEFLDFARSRNLTKSYKPVMLRAILKLINRDGEVKMADLVREFKAFYEQRFNAGQPVEFGVPLLEHPISADDLQIRSLIVKNPLDRFLIKGFLEYLPQEGIVRFAPQLWNELRFYELLDVQQSVDEQIRYYYNRGT